MRFSFLLSLCPQLADGLPEDLKVHRSHDFAVATYLTRNIICHMTIAPLTIFER